ncbi:NAD(P)-binding domain-containing protein [Demequina pelophila]|uniref:NAD(P)-binding domain-containing protein n=1 Tax=Demequina pelophila TaxID=1638984 RepID=UPI000781CF44|nr:NAD(P)-binding domain-containing protein [Demequina pelophila]
MPVPPSVDVVVIGAGQAGLAVAHHLARRGVTTGERLVVLDAEADAGGAWRHRWSTLTLGGAHRIHDLPGMRDTGLSFDDAPADRPANDVVPAYFRAYEDTHRLAVVRPARVTSVTREGDRYVLECAPGGPVPRLEARVVVSATGTWTSPRIPFVDGRDRYRGRQYATPDYPGAEAFAGLRVAVVGGGTSALTFLDEVGDVAASTLWFTRRRPVFHDEEVDLSPDRGRVAVSIQDEAARAGRPLPSIVSVTGLPSSPLVRSLRERGLLERLPMFTEMTDHGLVTADGDQLEIDAVIWATGFRPELRHLAPLDVVGEAGGVEVVDGRVAAQPGLFLAGYGPQASTISANRAARSTARQVLELLG